MSLKRISSPAAETSSKKKSDAPIIHVAGDAVKRYLDAKIASDDAEAILKEVGKDLKDIGLPGLYEEAIEFGKPISSVKVVDETGALATLVFSSRYNQADAAVAEAVFTELGADINQFAVEAVSVKFNNAVFFDAQGNFREALFDQISNLVKGACATAGIENPLEAKKVVIAKPTFHEKRWAAFPDVGKQVALSEALPNTISIKR